MVLPQQEEGPVLATPSGEADYRALEVLNFGGREDHEADNGIKGLEDYTLGCRTVAPGA